MSGTDTFAPPYIYANLLAELRARLGPLEGKRILEVGCGAGASLPVLRQLGADARGIDTNPALAREASEWGGVSQGDARELTKLFPAEGFDAVFGHSFFEHPVLTEREARESPPRHSAS